VRDGQRLVGLNTATREGGGDVIPISYPALREWQDQAASFDGIVGYKPARLSVRAAGEDLGEPVWAQLVSGNYFDVLGVRPALGRGFLPDEEGRAAPVAVIGDAYWKRRFGADPAIVGRHVTVNGVDVTIVGVAPPRFAGVFVGLGFDMWLPVTTQELLAPGTQSLTSRGNRWLQAFGRLKPGVTIELARTEMAALAPRLSEAGGESPVMGAKVVWMRDQFVGSLLSPVFAALVGVAALVLLTACANVGNLMLARAASREKEIGVRLALGAGRWRVVRQLMVESLLLAALGGGAGLLLSLWWRDALAALVPPVSQPVLIPVGMDARVIALAFALTLATALLFGLVPALRASKPDLVPVLKDEARSGVARGSRLRTGLAVAQMAFSFVSLVSAGFFLRGLAEAQAIDVGYADPGHVLLVTTDMSVVGADEAGGLAAADRLLEGARALPGVESASVSTMVPLGFGGHSYSSVSPEGYEPAPNEDVQAERVLVGDGYFAAAGVPILEGRALDATDAPDGMRVAVVNEAFARKFWPGREALGRHFDTGRGRTTVVGVARDAAYRDLGEAPYPVMYLPLSQRYAPAFTLHVRTSGDPKALVEPLRAEFARVDPNLPFLDARTMREHFGASTFVQYVGASTLGAFGTMALLLAAVGLYGVLSYAIAQRGREIAIRVALGATPRDVLSIVAGQGLRVVALGLAAGALLALGAGRLLGNKVVGVSADDPTTFVAVALVLGVVAALACLVPALRSLRVDPATVLKSQ
jgi:predicted permease